MLNESKVLIVKICFRVISCEWNNFLISVKFVCLEILLDGKKNKIGMTFTSFRY